MRPSEEYDMVQEILTVTEPGPISDWPDRIAAIARETETPVEVIRWSTAPALIAYDLIRASLRMGRIDQLKKAIKQDKNI